MKIKILGIIFILGIVILCICLISKDKKKEIDPNTIYITRDSISKQIDTVYIKLEDNNKEYEKNVNRIINNTTNEDYMFFLDYINTNRNRFISTD